MKEIIVKTAYGTGIIVDKLEKRALLGRLSDALSVRNSKYNEFAKELDELLNKYKL